MVPLRTHYPVSPFVLLFLSLLLIFSSISHAQVLEQDSLALVALYDSTDGGNWINNTNWKTSNPLYTWYGVGVSDGQVSNLSLAGNNLSGALPASIANLTAASRIDLSANQLTGSIPETIGSLNVLSELFLQDNQLNDTLPATIANMDSLFTLDISSNHLTGAVPVELVGMPQLTIFYLNDNQLMDFPDLSSLSCLQWLRIQGNRFTFEDIEPNIGAPRLEFIYAPQDSTGKECTLPAYEGFQNLTLEATAGGTANQHQWIKDGIEMAGATDSSLTIFVVGTSDTGAYVCRITNTIATELTLIQRPIHIVLMEPSITLDSLSLVYLFQTTNGDNWTENANWLNPDSSLADWHDVIVADSRVVELRLSRNNLHGKIPSSLGNLTELIALYLSSNELHGVIPPSLGNLTKLDFLHLSGNRLTGPIPPAIGNLVNLRYLDFAANNLTGPLPVEMGNMQSLYMCGLWGNEIDGGIPPEYGNLSNMMSLDIHKNHLSDTIPAELGNLSNVVQLFLNDNCLSGPIPPELGQLKKLENLRLSGNQLSGSIPPELGSMTNLAALLLMDNSLSGVIPETLGNLSKMSTLRLSNNQLTGAVPTSFANFTQLVYLAVQDNQLVDFPDLSALAGLLYLYIQNNTFTFEDIEPNIGVAQLDFGYAPQDSISSEVDTTVSVGDTLILSVTVGGSANHYQWMKDGIDIGAYSEKDSIVLTDITFADSGTYTCRITNDIAPLLTLYSQPIIVKVVEELPIDEEAGHPVEYTLHANYPNPFNPVSTIRYDLPHASDVSLIVYNILGREVVRLVDDYVESGVHQVQWDSRNSQGRQVPSGIYITRLVTPEYTKSIKMVLLK
jgi:Leucine-rich repeat (LRR) protein